MSALEPLVTAHSDTGAFRPIHADLLAETYLAPRSRPIDAVDAEAILSDPAFPWAQSLAVAPVQTAAAVLAAVRDLAMATDTLAPEAVALEWLPPDTRLHRHVTALRDLWHQAPGLLPEALSVFRHVLHCGPEDALEPLPLVQPGVCPQATPIERRLHAHLLDHHGLARPEQRQRWMERQRPLLTGATEGSSLWRVQRGLADARIPPAPCDSSVARYTLRDEAEEAEFAAALAQQHLDSGLPASAVAVLVPEDSGTLHHLRQAFDALGVPLSGLPEAPANRDLASETLRNLLLCLQPPAPPMALASLLVSPLMPWSAAQGAHWARALMSGRGSPWTRAVLSPDAGRLLATLEEPSRRTPAEALQQLAPIADLLTSDPRHGAQVDAFRTRIRDLLAVCRQGPMPDLDALLARILPDPPRPVPSERFVEGVSVFLESAVPWRPVRHLIALGMSGQRWPRPAAVCPLFLDNERRMLRERTGLVLPDRRATHARRMALLQRQLLSATETLTLLRPLASADGSPLPPAPALALVERTLTPDSNRHGSQSRITTGTRPVRTFPITTWPVPARFPAAGAGASTPLLPADGCLQLNRNLLGQGSDDTTPRHSPTRLETLLVSPLAWCLSEWQALPVPWVGNRVDPLQLGSLSHAVLEDLFPAGGKPPSQTQLDTDLASLLDRHIVRHAPGLAVPEARPKRLQLERTLRAAAHAWTGTLTALGAEVLANECELRATVLGLPLRGRVDCLLQLADGSLLVIDHKSGGRDSRLQRLMAGWDLQLDLYRRMLAEPAQLDARLQHALAGKPRIGIGYHAINACSLLLAGLPAPPGSATVIEDTVSDLALQHLNQRLADLRAGRLPLNRSSDRQFFRKTARLEPYALDLSPLIARFTLPEPPAAEAEGDQP